MPLPPVVPPMPPPMWVVFGGEGAMVVGMED
jgi:hypothetical protein